MAIKLSDRARIASQFELWCEEHGARLCAQAMLTFLDIIDVLDDEKAHRYLKTLRRENRSYTGIKKFELSNNDPKERKSKKK